MIRVEECESPYGQITIFRRRQTGAMIYQQFGSCQSEADRNGISLAPYIHAIYGLCLQADARRVLMIGCGGGTLGTMLARAGRKVTIVDVNPDAFVLARRHFGLPDTVECVVEDGRDHLASETRRYDAIVLDAYHGVRSPAHLRSREFFQLVKRRLSPRGCLFANVHVADDGDRSPTTFARAVGDSILNVRLLDADGYSNRNAIVMAGNVMYLDRPVMLETPAEQAEEIAAELASLQFFGW